MSERLCACPCRQPIVGRSESAIYADPDRCKQRAYRARVKAELAERGLTPDLTLKTVRSLGGSDPGHGDLENGARAASRPSTSGLQVSRRRAIESVAAMMERYYFERPYRASLLAEQAIDAALSDRQRERLEARS